MFKRRLHTLSLACLAVAASALLSGCCDTVADFLTNPNEIVLEVQLNMPGASGAQTKAIATRVGGENTTTTDLDYTTELQRYIGAGDAYVLIFEEVNEDSEDGSEDVLVAVPTVTLQGNNGDDTRTLTGYLDKSLITSTLKVDVVVNLAQNGYATSVPEARNNLVAMINQTREAVYDAIDTFDYPEVEEESNPYGIWSLSKEEGRYLPMWGSCSTALTKTAEDDNEWFSECNLYRSVAKMGVTVDDDCSTFDLKEVYIYYLNKKGKFISSETPDDNEHIQYTEPDVPTNVTQRGITEPQKYTASENKLLDQIYLAEQENNNTDNNPLVMVVGGIYKGGDYDGEGLGETGTQLNYYRIDMWDNGGGSDPLFNIVRNHSYVFNILQAENPGSSDPDPGRATDGLVVEVLDYTEVPLNGITGQYTLTVNQSLFAFDGVTTDVGKLYVSTDGVEWELLTDWSDLDLGLKDANGNEITSIPDWLYVTDTTEGSHTNDGDLVTIEPTANINIETARSGKIVLKADNVVKVVEVVQNHYETSNSYIVTKAGDYALKVDERGNGNTLTWTDADGNTEAIDFGLTDSIKVADIDHAEIIWETEDGFVTLDEELDLSASGALTFHVYDKTFAKSEWGSAHHVFEPGYGANALIGVYDKDDNLLWSWHIWGLGDYADGEHTEDWAVANNGSYTFMDRNLGAYSNLPGSASFGLLYQWGRKDPFIGAYRENREQDYHTVPKQYTVLYKTPGGKQWEWGNYDDSRYEDSEDGEKLDVVYTIQHPTTILEDGLLSEDHDIDEAKGLWGTEDYGYDNTEAGNKTMYDPCPVGYRVPSLNAFNIDDGTNDLWYKEETNARLQVQHSSHTLRFVPVKSEDEDGTSGEFRTGSPANQPDTHYSSDFVSDAPFYGFWLDYGNKGTFASGYTSETGDYEVGYYIEGTGDSYNDEYGYITGYSRSNPGKPNWATWIPLAGLYNGTMDHFARAGLTDRNERDNEPYLPASSLQVTSVLWANSPTETHDGFPAGLLLHGTEGAYTPHHTEGRTTTLYQYSAGSVTNGTATGSGLATEGDGFWTTNTTGNDANGAGLALWWQGTENGDYRYNGVSEDQVTWSDENGMSASGRHFHSFADTTMSVLANPSYAASVRCIRDKDRQTFMPENVYQSHSVVGEGGGTTVEYSEELTGLDLYAEDGGTTADEISLIVTFQEEWEVTSPGAKWISISPTSGTTTNGNGAHETLTIKLNKSQTDGVEEGATAQITIHFEATDKTVTFTVTYHTGARPTN